VGAKKKFLIPRMRKTGGDFRKKERGKKQKEQGK
jgi:hypothetical protein